MTTDVAVPCSSRRNYEPLNDLTRSDSEGQWLVAIITWAVFVSPRHISNRTPPKQRRDWAKGRENHSMAREESEFSLTGIEFLSGVGQCSLVVHGHDIPLLGLALAFDLVRDVNLQLAGGSVADDGSSDGGKDK